MTKETITKYCKEYLAIEHEISKLKTRQGVLKEKLIENLREENKPTKYNVGIKEVAPTTIFDSASFRKDNPSIYNQYRTKHKEGYITIKIVEI